jgi:serine/threonine protein kinase
VPILTENEWLGQRVAERYRLDDILSAGGMGVLFRGTDLETDQRVAVKMLKPAFTLDRRWVARFLRETRIAAALKSEHVAEVRAIWQDAAGVPFLVMELLEGRSLEEELEARGVLTLDETLAIAASVANALAAAHQAGIVHRDVKPANIFLCEAKSKDRVVKLLDFGIAKHDEDGFETQTGAVLGTPSYMAPEQAQHGDSGPYTDVWGLGAVIYRCLAGRPPHSGESSREILGKVLRDPVAPLVVPNLSRLVCAVIDRALCREPHRRYGSVEALMQALMAARQRAEAAASERTPSEGLVTQTMVTDPTVTENTDPGVERDLKGATRASSSFEARSLRPLGFMALGAALAVTAAALRPAPPSRAAISETKQAPASVEPRPSVAGLVLSPARAEPTAPEISSSPLRPAIARPNRVKYAGTPSRRKPGAVAEKPVPARVEHDAKSGLVVVTEW